jgi:nitroreductase
MTRSADTRYPLHPVLAERWSPRGFDTRHEIDDAGLATLLEAARWAPSAANTQPWRFVVARRGSAEFTAIVAALAPGNQAWADRASVLVVAAAQTEAPDGSPLPWAQYDTGQAVAHLSVQAHHDGLHIHQMGGFDRDRVADRFGLPATVVPQVVIALGRHDPDATLPEPYASRETAPRERLPLAALVVAGDLPGAREGAAA